MFLFALLPLYTICQLSTVPFKILETKYSNRILQFKDQLYAIPSTDSYEILQYNLTLGILTQAFTTTQTIHTIDIYNQTLYVGLSSGLLSFQLLIKNFQQSPYKNYSIMSDVYQICISDSYIITSSGTNVVIKWDIKTFELLEYAILNVFGFNYAMIHDSSFFISAYSPFEIQEYNINSISQKLASYSFELAAYLFKLEIKENNLFVGANLASVYQWNIQTKRLVKYYTAHENVNFYDFVMTDDYIFAVGNGLWLQFNITNGAIIRKVQTIFALSAVLIDPVLFVSGSGGIIAYRIPELNGSYSFDNWLLPATRTTTQKDLSAGNTFTTMISSSEVLTWTQATTTNPLTLKKLKKTSQHQQQSNEAISIGLLIPYIVGAMVFVLMVFILVYCLLQQKLKKSLKTNSTVSTSISTTTTTTFTQKIASETMVNISSSTMETSSNIPSQSTSYSDSETLFTTQNIYSIPGYLGIQPEEIRQLKQIAKGGQGTIFIGELLKTDLIKKHGKTVIIKSTNLKFHELSERQQNCFMQEISIIHYFRQCKGVVDLFGYTLEPAAMILKFYTFGSLHNLLKRNGSFSNFYSSKNLIIVFLYEISKTISLLHDSGFVHCDLKPQNILLEQNPNGVFHPILTDFGITQIVTDKVMKVKAMTIENLKGFSLQYAAPEQIKQLRDKLLKPLHPHVTKMRDIYAIGGILYAFISLKEPWE